MGRMDEFRDNFSLFLKAGVMAKEAAAEQKDKEYVLLMPY